MTDATPMDQDTPSPDDRPFDEGVFVSPPFSCGAGLLMDILLRLDIRVRPPRGEYWVAGPAGFTMPKAAREHYASHAACLAEQETFRFADRKSVVFEHYMRLVAQPARARILMVRDPVDAVFSWHRRFKLADRGVPFEAYMTRMSVFPIHLPHPSLIAPPLEIYALFVLFWLLVDEDLVVVRYEDLKQDPIGEVSRVLAALGAERTEDAIAEAARHSSFDAVTGREGKRPKWNETNLRSQTYEWRQRMSPADRAALTAGEPIASVCRMLSYDAPEGDGNIFEHRSKCWGLFGASIARLRLHFPTGLADPEDYFLLCVDHLTSLPGPLRSVEVNDVTIDAADMDAFSATMLAAKLLGEIFGGAPPQPLPMLERLITGMAAVLANGLPGGAFRHMNSVFGFVK